MVIDTVTARAQTDIDAFLQTGHHTVLADCPVFTLMPGDAVTIPCGNVAVVMATKVDDKTKELVCGRKKKNDVRKPEEYQAYRVFLPFDAAKDAEHTVETLQWINQNWISGLSRVPLRVKQHASVQAWSAKIEEVCAATKAEAPAPEGAPVAP